MYWWRTDCLFLCLLQSSVETLRFTLCWVRRLCVQSFPHTCTYCLGAGIACWLEHRTHDQKVASSDPGRSSQRTFFSRVNFSVCSTPMLLHWPIKDPGHSAKSAKVQVACHAQTCIHPWPNKVGVGWLCHCPGIVWEHIQKRANMQLVREHLVTVISARWATVDWSWSKERN